MVICPNCKGYCRDGDRPQTGDKVFFISEAKGAVAKGVVTMVMRGKRMVKCPNGIMCTVTDPVRQQDVNKEWFGKYGLCGCKGV